ncbi:MAG: hypothetical protein Q8L14_01965 [Myxococcales bacterium]|nr:hypothetical protein [Myxococcales bacterium]
MAAPRVHFVGPVVCRSPGLPFDRVTRFSEVPLEPAALAARLETDRRALWDTLDDPLVLDAFATMNPQTLGNLLATKQGGRHTSKRTSDVKRDERTLFKFLTRFASRNDTTGAAGSTFWGQWSDEAFAARVVAGKNRHERRVVLASPRRAAWVWHRVLAKLGQRRGTIVLAGRLRLTDDGVWNTESQRLWPLSPDALALLKQVIGKEAALVEGGAPLDALFEAGVVTLHVQGTDDPLDDLLGLTADPDVATLIELRSALSRARGVEAGAVMAQTEQLIATMAPLSALDLGSALEVVLDDVLVNAPAAVRVFRSPRFHAADESFHDSRGGDDVSAPAAIVDALRELDAPVPLSTLDAVLSAQHARALLDASVLLLESETPLDRHARLEARYASQVGALLAAGLPSPHHERVEALRDAWPLEGFVHSTAVAMGRLTEALDGAPVRTLKTDRTFFLEDTSRDATLELGATLSTRLKDSLEGWFQLAGYIGWLDEKRDAALMHSVLRVGEALPWPSFLTRLRAERRARKRLNLPAGTDDFSPLRFVARDDGRVELSIAQLPDAYLAWSRDKRFITELDLMLSGRDGMGQWVVNEAHALSAEGLPLVTMFPHAQPVERVEAMVGRGLAQRLFGEGVVVPDASVHSKQSEAILRVLGDARIAVSGQRGPWFPPWMTAIAASSVVIRRTAQALEAVVNGEPCPFASADFCSGAFRLVGYLPEDLGDLAAQALGEASGPMGTRFRPDVCMGALTLARGSLSFDVELLAPLVRAKGEAALRAEGARLSEALGLPRQVYLKLGGKPFLVDWTSVFSLEVLVSELRGATGEAHVSKMDPAPGELWLELPDGTFTSELRFIAAVDGPDCPLSR